MGNSVVTYYYTTSISAADYSKLKLCKNMGGLSKLFLFSAIWKVKKTDDINVQLNKGESIHSLRQAILYANEGKIRKSQDESQTNQVLCLNLMTNAVITWNTVYMQAVIDQLKREGYRNNEDDLQHISPARYVNLYGKFFLNVDQEFGRDKLRPLRAT